MKPHGQPLLLFDGVCNLCNGTVQFLLRHDRKAQLHFAPLQSDKGKALLRQNGLPAEHWSSFVLIDNNQAYTRSAAALRLVPYLPWYWQWARVFWLVPQFVRDKVYNGIARNRYRWFGKTETCMVPDKKVRERFIEH